MGSGGSNALLSSGKLAWGARSYVRLGFLPQTASTLPNRLTDCKVVSIVSLCVTYHVDDENSFFHQDVIFIHQLINFLIGF
jgi:hypothetical protein